MKDSAVDQVQLAAVDQGQDVVEAMEDPAPDVLDGPASAGGSGRPSSASSSADLPGAVIGSPPTANATSSSPVSDVASVSFISSGVSMSPSPSLSTVSSYSSSNSSGGATAEPWCGAASSALRLHSSSSQSLAAQSLSSDELFHSSIHANRSLQRMCSFYTSQQLCDVTLVAGERRFPAHRLVLSAASDYFSAMFTSGLAESRQVEVCLPQVHPASLETLLRYCYTGELEVRESTVECLLSTAHQLLLTEVVSVCCDYLASQLHPTNCIGIQLFADSQGCGELLSVAQKFTEHHFSEVCVQQEFVQLPLGSELLSSLLASEDLNVTSEQTVMEAVIAWLQHDLLKRKCHAAKMLSLVRLPLLPPQYISDYVESSELFKDDLQCHQLILEAMKHHLQVPVPLDVSGEVLRRARPRKSTVGTLYLVGGMDSSKAPVDVLSYDYRSNSWTNLSPPGAPVPGSAVIPGGGMQAAVHHTLASNTRRLQCAGGIVDGRLHIVGGRDGLKTLNTVEVWDHISGTWSSLPNMATHRHGLGVGVINGVVYSVGGHDGWSYLSTVERWDPGAKVWTYVAPMSTPRSSLGVAVLQGKLYAVGGRDGQSCLQSVERYDPHTNRWSPCAPMLRRRGGVGVAVINGYLYAVGGHDAPASSPNVNRLDCVERYDPAIDSWSLLSAGLEGGGRDSTAVSVLGSELLVCVGGYNGTAYLRHTQAYNTSTGEWMQLAPLPTGRAGACTVVIK